MNHIELDSTVYGTALVAPVLQQLYDTIIYSRDTTAAPFRPQLDRGVEIDRAVYTAAVRTCARSGETGRTLFLMKDAARRGMGLLPADTAAAMRTLTKQSAGWSQALAVYDVFLELAAGRAQAKSKLETSSDVTNLMGDAASDDLSGPFLGQGWQLRLLSEVTPGWEDVCQAALEACTKGEQWERALEVLNVLRAGGGGAELSREAYDKAIEVCGNGCAWDMVSCGP